MSGGSGGAGDSNRPSRPPPPPRRPSYASSPAFTPSSVPPASGSASGSSGSTAPPSIPGQAGLRIPSTRPPRFPTSAAFRLSSIDYDLSNAARRVIESALGLVPGERVVLVVDRPRRDVGLALLDVARTIGAEPVIHEIESHGDRPMRQLPDAVRSSLLRAQASVLLIGFDDGEVGMRLEMLEEVRAHGLRHAHMVGLTRKAMIAGFSVDHSRILDATRAVRTRLRPDSILRLHSIAGSSLEVQLDPVARWAEHVGVMRPGRWENLPSGKLTTCPANVRGVYVADASMGAQFGERVGVLGDTPVRFEIDGGFCRRITCPDRALQREIESFLAREHNLLRVGAITLGTNVGILEPTGVIVADQNLPGLHLTFGSSVPQQTGATWGTRGQLPMTAGACDVDLDGMPLLRSGRYMVT